MIQFKQQLTRNLYSVFLLRFFIRWASSGPLNTGRNPWPWRVWEMDSGRYAPQDIPRSSLYILAKQKCYITCEEAKYDKLGIKNDFKVLQASLC